MKVGDKVRIENPHSCFSGEHGEIIEIAGTLFPNHVRFDHPIKDQSGTLVSETWFDETELVRI